MYPDLDLAEGGRSMSKPKDFDEALRILARPIDQKFVKQKPDKSRADYVPHHLIRQWLHGVFDDHRFETLDVVVKGDQQYALKVRLHVRLGDEWRQYDGWGESENKKAPLKSAESDAVKRIAAMHLGLGLSLWSREHYFLPAALEKQVTEAAAEAAERDADYGGDGDEDPDDQPDAPVPQPDPQPTDVPEGEDEQGEGPPPPATNREKLTRKFHAQIRDLDLNYERHVRPTLTKIYNGQTLSQLDDDSLQKLVATLDSPSGAGRFKAKVVTTAGSE